MSTNIRPVTAQQMAQNFADLTYKMRPNGQVTKIDPKADALSVWYSKADIDQFFADNGFDGSPGQQESYGLRIYHGLHGTSAAEKQDMPNLPANYVGQHTGVLVVTIRDAHGIDQDQLDPTNSPAVSGGGGGQAMDEGNICPPTPPGQSCQGGRIVVK